MNELNVTEKTGKTKNNPIINDKVFEDVAMGGPGLVTLVRASDLKILFINDLFTHYLGYSNADLEGPGVFFSDILEGYQIERLLFQFSVVRDSIEGRSRYVIYHMKNKAGKISSFYLYAAVSSVDTGEEVFHFTLFPDVSRWDMPFTSFVTRELFLEQFNSEDFGTFEWLMDYDRVFWSHGLYRIYELEEDMHIINSSFMRAFIHPNDRDYVGIARTRALETGEDMNIEFRIITGKQNVKIIHCIARVIRNKAGKAMKFVGSIRDVTEQRSIEENLKNKVEELNHTNRELEEFAYVASHDLQEPLRKITTFSDRLSEKYKDVLSGDGIMYLSRMTAAAENMRTLIKDLLEFSRISKTVQPFEEVNLNTILQQVTTELELIIEETATVITSDRLPVISAVASQMKQLFTNIINNAIKFHKEGVPPVITIETSELSNKEKARFELSPNMAYYKIQITDNGIGFESEYATRIFQVFQRLHGKSDYPGSGIGLAICKKILEYHHGIIYAESMPETGSRFIFILPKNQ